MGRTPINSVDEVLGEGFLGRILKAFGRVYINWGSECFSGATVNKTCSYFVLVD
jgi:hypothetical protein